ncbi:aminotransferase class V-fold PLP-dependent enzyme [Halomonadaceae bacterium KBTZ08]
MSKQIPIVDPEGLLEYSVVFNDRSLNHMSQEFQGVMNDISGTLKSVYNAAATIVVPGGGSYGMEAVARQFANDTACLIVRNGWFSYRWSQILDAGRIASETTVHKARQVESGSQAPFRPAPVEEVVASIRENRPGVVFAPHVETAAGMRLPDEYLTQLASAAHEVGAIFVLDCVASGALWVDMAAIGVDVLISAPQKGWSASPCAALVMLSDRGLERLEATTSSSFAGDLKKWHQIMQAYEGGGHAYHATMPTDSLKDFRDAMQETVNDGLDATRERQEELGRRVRALFAERGFVSVAAEGFEAPGVVVLYTRRDDLHKGSGFIEQGLQTAAGVPLACDEPEDYKTFRVGLFGLDKLRNIDRTVDWLAAALDGLGV